MESRVELPSSALARTQPWQGWMQELRETIIRKLTTFCRRSRQWQDRKPGAVIARTGFFVLSSVFKERPRPRKVQVDLNSTRSSNSHQIK
jgi:hypothetical protein